MFGFLIYCMIYGRLLKPMARVCRLSPVAALPVGDAALPVDDAALPVGAP